MVTDRLEAADFGEEISCHSDSLVGLKKQNKIAIMISNEAYSALEWFNIDTGFPP